MAGELSLNHEQLSEQEALARFHLYLQDLENRFDGFRGLTTAFDSKAPRHKSLETMA
jgi:hypothetical protein